MGPNDPLPGLPGWPRDSTRPDRIVSADPPIEDDRAGARPRRSSGGARQAETVVSQAVMLPAPEWSPPAVVTDPVPVSAPREPTLTAQIRSVQPPDVARQAVSELGVLARELDTLPDVLADAGLARSHLRAYLEAVQSYLDLCRYAWEAVAEEQLEHIGAEAEYRQHAVSVARRIQLLKQDAAQVTTASTTRPRRGLALQWRRRVYLVRLGLATWQQRLEPAPNPQQLGTALFTLQGYIGLASAGGLELALLDLLLSSALVLLGFFTGGAVCLLIAALFGGGSDQQVAAYAAVASMSALGWAAVLGFGVLSPLPFGQMLGASVFVPARAAGLGWQGSQVVAGLLRLWWLVIGLVAVLLVPAAVVLGSVVLTYFEPLPIPTTALQAVAVVGLTLYAALVLAAGVAAAALVVLTVPFACASLVRFAREAADNVQWVPLARRYALRPALGLVVFVTLLLLGLMWSAGTTLSWEHVALLEVNVALVHGALSLRGLACMLVLALPYLFLLDLPYRIGMRRWRAKRLADLESRRLELESQVRQLATQMATEELLRAMQYDLVLLQFYRAQIDEARATSPAPYRIEGRALAIVISVAGALVLDSMGSMVLRLLTGQQ